MNTLSSLLNWIGETIGSNPNTLVTTSKKIVGAINEAVGASPSTLVTTAKNLVGAINEAVGANPNTLTTTSKNLVGATNELKAFNDIKKITVTAASTTTGTLGTVVCRRSGNVVWVSVQVTSTGSVASGGTVFSGTLSSNLPRPYFYVISGGYYGEHAISGGLSNERFLRIVNASPTAVNVSTAVTVSFAYITQD